MKKFEFVLYINGNIICQRYFSLKNFNKHVIKSMDLKECVNDCVDMIKEDMKEKSIDYLYRAYNPHVKQTQEELDSNRQDIYEKEDIFDFEIKVDDKSVIKERFTGNIYPQRVRYSVDIRSIIPIIISKIQETFSREKFDVEYSGISL
jgi:hypothetical protein